ncbi:MAG: MFS transporter [Acidimicrobiales bacterium]
MTTTVEHPQIPGPLTVEGDAKRKGRWIDRWEPDDEQFWESGGKKIARKNLILSIFAEHIGFNIWILWTIVVVNLADVGLKLSVPALFWLTAVPNLVGSALRLPYTFAIPKFGGRLWTTISASLLLIPALLLAIVVPSGWLAHQGHATQLWVLLGCAATAGFGGGNFSSSMANISFFYPEKRKGLALGLNAAGGNLGVAVAQLLVPLVIIVGVPAAAIALPVHHVHLAYAGLVYLPFIVIAATLAWLRMDSLTQAKTDRGPYIAAVKSSHTWIMSILYIGTFGSFIGYSFALPLVMKNTFPEFLGHHPFIANYLAGLGFLGALVGSLSRPLGGWLSDRLAGAGVTFGVFIGMAVLTGAAIAGVQGHNFPVFFGSFMVIFALSGIGNGSTYRMIPSIFRALGQRRVEEQGTNPELTTLDFKRQAAAVIGIAGAVGAFGGFIIQVVFRQSNLHVAALIAAAKTPAQRLMVADAHLNWSTPALWVFLGAYVVLAGITWFFYLRKGGPSQRMASMAYASI